MRFSLQPISGAGAQNLQEITVLCAGLKNTLFAILVGSRWQEGQGEGLSGLQKLPLNSSLPSWLQQRVERVWNDRAREDHKKEACCCEGKGLCQRCYEGWAARGLVSMLLSLGRGAACCITDHHAWVRTKEELVTRPLSSGAKNSNPANMTVAFWIPFQH